MTIPFSYSTPEKVDTRAVDTRAKVIKFINMDVSTYLKNHIIYLLDYKISSAIYLWLLQ